MGKDGGHDTYFPGRAAESRSGIKQKSSKIVHQGRPFISSALQIPRFLNFVGGAALPGAAADCVQW